MSPWFSYSGIDRLNQHPMPVEGPWLVAFGAEHCKRIYFYNWHKPTKEKARQWRASS